MDRIKGPQEKMPKKCRKIDATAKVLTEAMYIKKIKESKKPTKLSQKKIDFGKKNKDDVIDEQGKNGDYVDENYDDLILDEEFEMMGQMTGMEKRKLRNSNCRNFGAI